MLLHTKRRGRAYALPARGCLRPDRSPQRSHQCVIRIWRDDDRKVPRGFSASSENVPQVWVPET